MLKKWSECHKKTSISPFGLLISLHLTKELSWNILSAKILTSTFFNSKFYVVFSYTQAIKKYFLGPTYKKTSSTEQLKSVSEILVNSVSSWSFLVGFQVSATRVIIAFIIVLLQKIDKSLSSLTMNFFFVLSREDLCVTLPCHVSTASDFSTKVDLC